MERERFRSGALMAAFALIAAYMACDGLASLAEVWAAVRANAPAVVLASADGAVLPGAVGVFAFAALEIVRPGEGGRRILVAVAFGAALSMLVVPVGLRLAGGSMLRARGYQRCAERVTGYTLPAVRYAREVRGCMVAR